MFRPASLIKFRRSRIAIVDEPEVDPRAIEGDGSPANWMTILQRPFYNFAWSLFADVVWIESLVVSASKLPPKYLRSLERLTLR